ncbi:uncharacterized protein [Miscanthus floridulus]|uniref:uncharacterized protein isoform X1 n=1 Tax=Miscanthus floridulus TaxID=154761 RepID=UPI00345A5C24
MTLAALICDTGQRKALKVNRHLSEGAAAGLLAGRCKPTTAYETIKKLLKLAELNSCTYCEDGLALERLREAAKKAKGPRFVVGNQDLLKVFLELLRGSIPKVLQNLL